MNYIEYFNDKEKDKWKNQLRKQETDWKAISYLIYLLDKELVQGLLRNLQLI